MFALWCGSNRVKQKEKNTRHPWLPFAWNHSLRSHLLVLAGRTCLSAITGKNALTASQAFPPNTQCPVETKAGRTGAMATVAKNHGALSSCSAQARWDDWIRDKEKRRKTDDCLQLFNLMLHLLLLCLIFPDALNSSALNWRVERTDSNEGPETIKNKTSTKSCKC